MRINCGCLDGGCGRNYSIDGYRMFLAFGIVLFHVCSAAGVVWPTNVLNFCVPAFAIITGYFGAGFRISKVIRLYATASMCLFVLLILRVCLGVGWRGADLSHWWFLHAYIIMIVLSPFVDELFVRAICADGVWKAIAAVIPLWIVVFGWGWLVGYNHLSAALPVTNGLSGFSFLTLLGAYAVGRVIRTFDIEKRLPMKWILCGCFITGSIVSLSGNFMASYNNPLCMLLAACTFILFARLKVPRVLCRIAAWFAPSMFAVYLLHLVVPVPGDGAARAFVVLCLKNMGNLLVVAAVVFMCSILLDLPRRIMVLVSGKLLRMFCAWCDDVMDKFIRRIVKRCSA